MENLTELEIQKSLKLYANTKKIVKKYNESETGRVKRKEANERWYYKMRENPEWMKKQSDKSRIRYQKRQAKKKAQKLEEKQNEASDKII